VNVANSSQLGPYSPKKTFEYVDNFVHNSPYANDVGDILISVNNTNNCNLNDVYGNRTNLGKAIY